ncbi:MAG: capsular polysaccharide transport system permease protein [Candidatus Azotimanducaceae bacterium]|jgi:capsular polysaccharide transport system permease protein
MDAGRNQMTEIAPQTPDVKPAASKGNNNKVKLPQGKGGRPAHMRKRHYGMILSFVIIVLIPIAIAGTYLYTRAADQYSATLGFTVRSEDVSSAVDLLGGLGSTLGGGSGTQDSDILYEFMRSQQLVQNINEKLGLRTIYTKQRDSDWLLSFNPKGTIEDLTRYWQRMVRVSYNAGSGLMEIRVLAFTPEDAKAIANEIFIENSAIINELSAIARSDAMRYATEDLEQSIERLKQTREKLTTFRLANQIVDPNADIQAQMGLLTTLQTQQAEALIDFDLLSDIARESDPRLEQAQRRIEVIETRINAERQKFGVGGAGPGGVEFATIISEFERLAVDREFSEAAYAASLSARDAAVAEANRQSRYLAAYIKPTLAERSEFPQRLMLVGIIGLFSFLIWAIFSLVYYSLRDRR